jgi:hypothetical protein
MRRRLFNDWRIFAMNRIIFVFLILPFVFLDVSKAYADDTQHWNAYVFKYKINDKVRLLFNPSFRLQDDVTKFFYWESRQGVEVNLHEHFDLGLHYLYGDTKGSNEKWTDEHRIEIQPTLKWQWRGFKFSDRTRAEYRHVSSKDKWRFRNRIKIDKPLKFGKFSFTPYIYNEFFYDAKKDQYNQNRGAAGFSKKLSANSSIDVYYMKRTDKKSGRWTGIDVIGTTISFAL